jgi:hypothetical protein
VLPYPRKKSILYAEAASVRLRLRGGLVVAVRDLGARPWMAACVVLRLALALALELEPRLVEPPLLHFLPLLVL